MRAEHLQELEARIKQSEWAIGKSIGEALDQVLQNQITLFTIFIEEAKEAK